MSNWDVNDDAAAAIANYPPNHPYMVVMGLAAGLANLENDREVLGRIVTPESRPAWGDFTPAVAAFESWGDWGLGSRIQVAEGASDVAYARFFLGIPDTIRATGREELMLAAIVTLVWRPEHDIWMIHGIGPEPLHPDDVPRTSPNNAPRVDLWS